MAVSNTLGPSSLVTLEDALASANINPAELAELFGNMAQQLPMQGMQSKTPSTKASSLSATTEQASTAGTPANTAPNVSAGSGSNSVTIQNSSNHIEKIGEFLNGASTTTPVAEITLKPGESGTLSYQNGQGGYIAEADASGTYQPTASRLEFYADANGVNNTDVSYIDGRNASIEVSDGQGKTAGDTKSIADAAPESTLTHDSAGNATVAGWYDGSSSTMQAGGAYMEQQLGTGNAYIHPNDDQNRADNTNPMTMAQDKSQTYTAKFGDA